MHHLEKLKPLTLLLLHVGVGIVFMHNGYPKFTWEKQTSMHEMVQSGLPVYFTYVAGLLELCGGALLVCGLFTRLIGLLLAGEMAIAMWKAEHILTKPLAVNNYELALALAAGAFALATFGAGPISLDRLFFGKEGSAGRGSKSRG